jgi:uncharacterized membrane protein
MHLYHFRTQNTISIPLLSYFKVNVPLKKSILVMIYYALKNMLIVVYYVLRYSLVYGYKRYMTKWLTEALPCRIPDRAFRLLANPFGYSEAFAHRRFCTCIFQTHPVQTRRDAKAKLLQATWRIPLPVAKPTVLHVSGYSEAFASRRVCTYVLVKL